MSAARLARAVVSVGLAVFIACAYAYGWAVLAACEGC